MAHSVTRSGSLKSSLIIWWTFYYLGLTLAFKLATSEALSDVTSSLAGRVGPV